MATSSPENARAAYARYGRALLRKAERILQSRADAQDIVHALFADLLQHEAPLDLPYLYRAVHNRCLTFLRDTQNRPASSKDATKPSAGRSEPAATTERSTWTSSSS